MGDDYAVSAKQQCVTENLLVFDGSLAESAFGNLHPLDNGILSGEKQNPAFFVVQSLHHGIEIEPGT